MHSRTEPAFAAVVNILIVAVSRPRENQTSPSTTTSIVSLASI